jgi:NADH:ubiquinone oxidoreductase subunit F (NADH-binding)
LTVDAWKRIREAEGNEKYVVCNAIDGDNRARTARLLAEGNPHSLLEGVMIVAYAVGASRCIVSLAVSNDGAVRRIKKALEQMRDYGLVGENILGAGFDCDIEIRQVEPSLVLDEETALLRLLEGKQAIPYLVSPGSAITFKGRRWSATRKPWQT